LRARKIDSVRWSTPDLIKRSPSCATHFTGRRVCRRCGGRSID
jgi:hypothetical protein